MKALVYRHRRLDTNKVFYVGVAARSDRPNSKYGRNKHWHNIVKKCGYSVEILTDKLPYKEALELECLLISEYGRLDLGTGCLVNMTDGGEGICNVSEDTRKRMSKSMIGKQNSLGVKRSLETKNKIKKASKMKPVIQILNSGQELEFESIKEAYRNTGVNVGNISMVCKGKRPKAGGFKWKYKW